MADTFEGVKIDALPEATQLAETDKFVKDDGETTEAITFSQLISALTEALGIDDIKNDISELESVFTTLVEDHCIYYSIEDSDGDTVLDSDDDSLNGTAVYKLA